MSYRVKLLLLRLKCSILGEMRDEIRVGGTFVVFSKFNDKS